MKRAMDEMVHHRKQYKVQYILFIHNFVAGGKLSNRNENEVYYCQLHRQILLLESTADNLDISALAVGLAERSSVEPL